MSRSWPGEADFAVKEGVGTEEAERLAGWQISSDDAELRDGFR